jgi:small GTP-binding protein
VPERRSRDGSVKVVITGPYGVGKTTLIRTLSEIDVLTTERRVSSSEEEAPGKTSTTVAMDFGRLTIDESLQLYLFGTPGQKRFEFMWEILKEGMLGFIVMLDDSRPDSHEQALEILENFTDHGDVPYVVVVNKVLDGREEAATRRAAHFLRLPGHIRVITTDARDRASAKKVLLELFEAVRDSRTSPSSTSSSA